MLKHVETVLDPPGINLLFAARASWQLGILWCFMQLGSGLLFHTAEQISNWILG
jgi:hypothetical protein